MIEVEPRAGPEGARPQVGDRVTWFGHSTVRIDLDGVSVLTDPVLRRWIGPLRRTGPVPGPAATTALDVAIVSHGHHDHLDLGSLSQLPPTTTVIVPAGTGAVARRAATGPVVELAVGESFSVGEVTLTAVPAHHDGRRIGGGRIGTGRHGEDEPTLAVGYLIQGRRTVWFAGDTGPSSAMNDLRGRVDLALVPIGGWGLTLGPHHLDARQAADVCALIRPGAALPIHWGTLAVPGTRTLFGPLWARQDGARFRQALAQVAPGTRALVPAFGEPVVWTDDVSPGPQPVDEPSDRR